MKALTRFLIVALVVAVLTPSSSQAGPYTPLAFEWTPLSPVWPDLRATLQSEPALALAGSAGVIAWTDSRNAMPDLYAAYVLSGTVQSELRVTNRTPHFSGQAAKHPAVVLETGRTFFAWSDVQHIFVSRLNISGTTWTSRTQVTTFSHWSATAYRPRLAGDGNGQLNLVWTDWRPEGSGRPFGDIYAARCNGNATPITCTANVKLNDDADTDNAQLNPDISRNGNQVIVVWEDSREAGLNYPRIYASISNDGGATWGANMRVNKRLDGSAPGLRDAASRPAVTHAPDGSIYTVWEHRSGAPTAPADIYVARWDGSSWSTPWRVDAAPSRVRSINPAIAAHSTGVFVAWQDYRNGSPNPDIYTARWNGSAWTETPAVVAAGAQTLPALRASTTEVRLAWQDERAGQADVYSAAWNGSAWGAPVQLNTNPSRLPYQMSPALASFGGHNWLLFTDRREGMAELYAARMVSFTQWGASVVLPTQASVGGSLDVGSGGPAFTGDGRLHAVWSDYYWTRGMRAVYAVLSGTTWSPPILLSRVVTGNEMLAMAAAFGNTVAAGWTRYDSDTSRANLYATWNTGSGWITETAVLTTPRDAWRIPFALAVDAANVYVAWQQPRSGQGDALMLARRSLSGAGGWTYHRIDQDQNVSWCPNYAPALKVDQAGLLHAVWTGCLRRNPANTWPLDGFVLYAYSTDQGATWSAPLRLAQTSVSNADGRTKPALAVGASGRVLAVFPSLLVGNGGFVAAMVQNAALVFTHTITAGAGWTHTASYEGVWYEGDSAGSVSFDPVTQRFIVAIIDRSSGRAPRILVTTYGDTAFAPRVFIPMTRR
ncbi:MAG: sialidase family protein [Anaerolineae bacterium]|nr:glycoside hydrolase [Thermoflexales bacterium]MDW8406350.1 sialidase family protein [Anaerolineae bacterium]